MTARQKDPNDLTRNPQISMSSGSKLPELPVNTVTARLTVEDGPQLELMARTNPRIVTAVQVGYIYSDCIGSSYVKGRIDQLLRLSVSMNGLGRRDMIDSLQAGGKVPDAYYNAEGGTRGGEFSYIREDQ